MDIYRILDDEFIKENAEGDWYNLSSQYLIICEGHEVPSLIPIFKFEKSTIGECISVDQCIKLESFEGYDFVTFNFIDHNNGALKTHEINIYVSKNFLIFVCDRSSSVLSKLADNIINKRYYLLQKKGLLLNKIYYLIFDRTIAKYFETLEEIEDKIEEIEGDILLNANRKQLVKILEIKSQINYLRKNVSPTLYIGEALLLNDNDIIMKPMEKYFRDLNMRINKLNDFSIELRHLITETSNAYDSKISSKTNDKATIITIIAAFFAPPTVIAGIYGMNFRNMPELDWRFGYPFAVFLMLATSGLMYIILKRKKWL